ncbi:MAG: serine/threonine-protein phosphatase [Clostridia bacterium]|nr:serine/threonine-protein phosphatase [Clostridia bacterium]
MNKPHISATVVSNKGKVRTNNEDNFFLEGYYLTESNRNKPCTYSKTFSNGSHVFAVFDGMGGEECGEEASLIASQVLAAHSDKAFFDEPTADKFCENIIKEANKLVCKRIRETGLKRMGTTCVIACIYGNKAKIYNIGDSRAYLLRNGELCQISIDDTVVMFMVENGEITLEEAATHKDRHKITQHLGIFEEEFSIETHASEEIVLDTNDKLLLCSDGLTEMVSNERIGCVLGSNDSEKSAKALVKEALNNGGVDNTTTLVIGVEKPKIARKLFFVISCIVVLAILIVAVLHLLPDYSDDEYSTKEYIYWSEDVTEIAVDKESWFSVSCGENTDPENLRFYSSDSSVLEVDESDGYYTAHKEGTVVVTVKCGNAELSKEVKVVKE